MQLSQYCSSSTDSPTSKYAICVGALPQYTQNFLFMDRIFIMFSAGITNGSISRAFLPSVTIFLIYLHDRELLRIAAKFYEKFLSENIVSIFGKRQRKSKNSKWHAIYLGVWVIYSFEIIYRICYISTIPSQPLNGCRIYHYRLHTLLLADYTMELEIHTFLIWSPISVLSLTISTLLEEH